VYCRSGNRSSQAATMLKAAGFTNVTDLGGLSAVEKIDGKLVQ
jgi:rhodanese-related sulfurtransferase